MAVVFEIVLNLGTGDDASAAAERVVADRAVAVRGASLPLAGPFVSGHGGGRYIELSVVVPAIGAGGPTCTIASGLVLANDVADRLRTRTRMHPFDPDHVWMPYDGDRSLWAADR